MVSKQKKYIRQQAILHAEKYKEEQAKKLGEINTAKFAQNSAVHDTIPKSPIIVYPATSRRLRVSGTNLNPNSSTSNDVMTSPVTEKKPLKKTLTSNKKGRHASVAPGPYCGMSRPISASKGHRLENSLTSTTYNIAGGIAPEIVDLEVAPPLVMASYVDTDMFASDNAHIILTYGSQSAEAIITSTFTMRLDKEISQDDLPKLLFSWSFAGAEFAITSDANTIMLINKLGRPELDSAILAAFHAPNGNPFQRRRSLNSGQGRKIFDILWDCAHTKFHVSKSQTVTDMAPGVEIMETRIASTHRNTGAKEAEVEPSERLLAFVLNRREAPHLPQVSEPVCHSACAVMMSQSMPTITPDSQAVCCLLFGWTLEKVSSKSVAWVQKETQCLQHLEMEFAAGPSSEATIREQAQKSALVLYRPLVLSFCPPEHAAKKLPRTESEHHLWASQRMFFADTDGHTRLVDFIQTLYDVEVTIDDGASDFDSVASPVKIDSGPAPVYYDAGISSSEEDDEDDFLVHLDGFQELACTFIAQESQGNAGDSTPATTLSFSGDDDVIDATPSSKLPGSNANVVQDIKDMISYEAFSAGWARELTRLTLGTESLFTFLDLLEIGDNGSATKSAVVGTYLRLVNLERKKLGNGALPVSYSASSVIVSKIMPHTIFLGTISLANFLSHFEFSSRDETTIDEVYRIFTLMQKEDLQAQMKATTGIMGELGRRLVKLPRDLNRFWEALQSNSSMLCTDIKAEA